MKKIPKSKVGTFHKALVKSSQKKSEAMRKAGDSVKPKRAAQDMKVRSISK